MVNPLPEGHADARPTGEGFLIHEVFGAHHRNICRKSNQNKKEWVVSIKQNVVSEQRQHDLALFPTTIGSQTCCLAFLTITVAITYTTARRGCRALTTPCKWKRVGVMIFGTN